MRIKVNPNKDIAEAVRQALRDNNNYCPCRTIKNEDTLCPCKEFREGPLGECHCGLYIKIEE